MKKLNLKVPFFIFNFLKSVRIEISETVFLLFSTELAEVSLRSLSFAFLKSLHFVRN